MNQQTRIASLRFVLCAAIVCLSATPTVAAPLWLYDVSGMGWWFENGENTGQQRAISGSVVVELISYLPENSFGFWWVDGRADFDLEFNGYDFITADEFLRSTNDKELVNVIGGIGFVHDGASPADGACFDPMLAGGCFGGVYKLLLFPDEAPLWYVGADKGLSPERITLSNGRPVPDPGSSLLLLGIGLVGLRAGRNRWR